MNFLVIGGQTGCGKTILLNKFDNSLDLEGFANHRGSAFGNNVTPQLRSNVITKSRPPMICKTLKIQTVVKLIKQNGFSTTRLTTNY